jgi:DNA-binding SARP family transcriptional activator/tetratricopeptide (TPR) repeat protein
MEFWILGPLEVVSGGQPLDPGGTKQRALLAVLLLHANSVVSTDRLIDALWEDDPPESAHKALQVHVSGLRKLLGRERVQTKAPGYLLRVHQGELDLDRFRELQEGGRAAEALSLWRGPPLGDFAHQRFAEAEIARLEELRLACVEARIEQDLEAGRHVASIGELEALVKEHPLRESLRAQLMLALYRCGRQADALDAYQQARAALVEELGIEPGRALRELQQAILNQDPALDAGVAAQTPPGPEPDVAEARADRQPRPRETRKTVTVLCAAVAAAGDDGARLDPEKLRRIVSRSFAEIQIAAEQHGGSLETIAGDTITVVFGLPHVHEDDALRAMRAAADLRERLRELADEVHGGLGISLAFHCGVSTGEIVAGGGLQPLGEPLTAAHRLAQQSDDGDVLLDGNTHRLLRDAVFVEPADGALRLVGLGTGPPENTRGLRSPMVGRDRERRRLQDVFEQAIGDRSCQLFTVLGAAGVGKSRLVEEFLRDVPPTALVTRGRCLPYGEGITYWPVTEAVKEAIGLDDADAPDEAQRTLVAALGDEPRADPVAQAIAEIIGAAEGVPGAEDGFAAVRTLFETLARGRPLVVVFDDIHWGEPTFLDLIEHLADWTRDAPVLLVCLARPELLDARPGWSGGKLNATSILLEPLSEAESVELIENLAAGRLEQPVKARIVEAAEGNPLFVEEMLALTLENGADGGELAVPATIQALLAARLDRLGDEERVVVEHAAVVGKVFEEDALAELAPPELRPVVQSALAALLRKDLIRPDRPSFGGRTYRFRHLLIRDAAYEAIPKERRVELHECFARWLERAAGERAVEYQEIVGYHLEQAYRYRAEFGKRDAAARAVGREAAVRLGAAGQRAFVRDDAPAAVNLVSRAVLLLPADDALRVELIPNVRAMQGTADDLSWADRALTEAVEAAATTGDRRLAAHALVQRGFLRLFTELEISPAELFGVAERALAVFDELGDHLGIARAWRLIAQAHYLDRRGGASADASEKALAHVRKIGDRFEETEIVTWLAVVLALGPAPAGKAVRRCEKLLGDVAGNAVLEVLLPAVMGYLEAMQNRVREARECFDKGRARMHELGEVIWIYWLFALMADPVSGERELHWATELLDKIGEKSHYSSTAAVLARANYAQGRYDEAEMLTRAAEDASRPNDIHGQIMWRSIRAKVLARRGELQAAEVLGREAITFAEQSDFLNSHAHALADFAEILEIGGRSSEAADALREAIALYERKENLFSAASAHAALAKLERRTP